MSLLNHTHDFSSTPSAIRQSLRVLGRSVWRAINNAIAAIIAQREQQASLTILRKMSDRDLRDIGLARSEIGAGLAQAAKERMRTQRLLAARL